MKHPNDSRKYNKLSVIRNLCELNTATKNRVSRLTGLTLVTVNSIINELFKENVIIEAGNTEGAVGRRSVVYKLNTDNCLITGFNIGMDYVAGRIEALNGRLKIRDLKRIKPNINYDNLIDLMENMLLSMMESINSDINNIAGVGIAIPGAYNEKISKIMFSPNVPCLLGKDLKNDFKKRISVAVEIDKDVYAGVLGMKDRFSDNVFALFSVRGGIGCGVINNGHIIKGADYMAGEVGHVSIDPGGEKCSCGNKGCLEMYASDYTIIKKTGMTNLEQLINEANGGNKRCLDIMRRGCDAIIDVLKKMCKFYNPAHITVNCRWIYNVKDVKRYFFDSLKGVLDNIYLIDDEFNYEHGAVYLMREHLLQDINNNVLINGGIND